jgi:uncharacterized protein YecE (DUF72 family)
MRMVRSKACPIALHMSAGACAAGRWIVSSGPTERNLPRSRSGARITQYRIGTAGWGVPRTIADEFPASGPLLQRYAGRFDAVEINRTFYRSPRPQTLARWVETVPETFRFAVKVPKSITHERGLVGAEDLVSRFLDDIAPLGAKLGPLLVQLPPKLAYDSGVVPLFFSHLCKHAGGPIVCEPRHPSWFDGEAERVLQEHGVARVAAVPARVPQAAQPGGNRRLEYWRLHGSPRIYFSAYDGTYLQALAVRLRASPAAAVWCIFDNTASGAAAANALALMNELR